MKPTPAGWPRISASVYYEDPRKAIDFLVAAFGFEAQVVHEEGGAIVHSQLVLPGGMVMVGGVGAAGAHPEHAWRKSPAQLQGANTQALFIYVDDADAHCARARAAGATIVREPTTVDYGAEWWSDRGYEAADPEGHHWHFAHRVR